MNKTLQFPLTNVEDFIPQRPPVVMISSIENCKEESASTTLQIDANNIFVDGENLSESGMMENIAQSAAAMVGVKSVQNNTEVPVGFIGGINKVQVHGYAKVGQTIRTEIKTVQEVFNISMIEGKCFLDDECMLSCQMKIVLNP